MYFTTKLFLVLCFVLFLFFKLQYRLWPQLTDQLIQINRLGNRVDNDVDNQLWFMHRRYASVCDVHNNILFFSQLMYYTNSFSDRSDRNISMLSWERSLRNQRNDLGAFRMNLIHVVCGEEQRVVVLLRPYSHFLWKFFQLVVVLQIG